MNVNKTRAFTLIELLVVIAIIAILAAILFPVFAQAKTAAKKAKAIAQMKQIATGTLMYMTDYDDMVPPKVRIGYGPANGGGDPYNSMTWDDFIFPYTKNWTIFTSSEDARPLYNVPQGKYRRSFAPASNVFLNVQPSPALGWGWSEGIPSMSATSMPRPSETVLFVEARQPVFNVANIRNANEWWYDVPAYNTRTANLPSSDPRSCCGMIDNKYADGSVFVFSDSSAKVLKRGGVNSSGLPSGTMLPGYEEKAAWWVGSPDPYWDRGVSCLDAPWNPADLSGGGRPCNIPQ